MGGDINLFLPVCGAKISVFGFIQAVGVAHTGSCLFTLPHIVFCCRLGFSYKYSYLFKEEMNTEQQATSDTVIKFEIHLDLLEI